MREAFALQKLLTFFFNKNIGIFEIFIVLNFNETLTKDIVSFEQPGTGLIVPSLSFNLKNCQLY